MNAALKVWKDTCTLIRKYPGLIAPFMITAVIQVLAVYVLFLAPQRPVSALLAPPIRAFFGERFLHYPYNLFLLPKLFYYARICIGGTLGILMAGTSLGMIREAKEGHAPRFLPHFAAALRRCLTLLGIWILMFVLSFGTSKVLQKLAVGMQPAVVVSIVIYLLSILIQTAFVYAMPAVILNKSGVRASIVASVRVCKKFIIATVLLLMVPSLLYLFVLVLHFNVPGMTRATLPEAIFVVIAAEILVSFFMDIFMTLSPALLFLQHGEVKK